MFPENFRNKKYSIAIVIFIYSVLSYCFNAPGWNIFENLIVSGEGQFAVYPCRLLAAKFSFWNPYVQCGTYTMKDMGIQQMYPIKIILDGLFPGFPGYNINLLMHYVLAGVFTYMFCGKLKLNPTASFIGGLSFMFCGFMVAHRGHQTMVNAAVWLPLVLYFVESFFQDKKYIKLLLASVTFAMCILADYIAMPMYIGMIVFPYIVLKVYIIDTDLSHIKRMMNIVKYSVILFGIGLLLCSVYIFPISEALEYMTRENIDYKFFSSFSFRWKFLPLILFPFFYGTHNPGFYPVEYFVRWNLVEMAGYMGIIPLVSAFLSFSHFRKKNINIYFWGVVAIVAFILVLGSSTPLYRLMYHVPVYNMFRAPARNWFEVNFAVSILLAYFIHYVMSEKIFSDELVKRIKRGTLYLSVITLIIILVVVVVNIIAIKINDAGSASWIMQKTSNPEAAFEQLHLFIKNTKLFPTSPAIYIPLIIIGISILFFLNLKKYYNKRIIWIAVSVFLFFDFFSWGHFHDSDYGDSALLKNFDKNEIFSFLKKEEIDLNSFRIYPLERDYSLLYPQVNILYGISTINAYTPMWTKNYQKLTGFKAEGISEEYMSLLENPGFLSNISVKYILSSSPDNKKMLSEMKLKKTDNNKNKAGANSLYVKKFETSTGQAIFENTQFLPRTRFVSKIVSTDSIDIVKKGLQDNSFNTGEIAFVENLESMNNLSIGEVIHADYSNSELIKVRIKTYSKSFLILSDTFYPGWTAYIDSIETKIYKVNGVTRGIIINDNGEHEVIFSFKPVNFYSGLTITIIIISIIVIYIIFFYGKEYFLRNTKNIG